MADHTRQMAKVAITTWFAFIRSRNHSRRICPTITRHRFASNHHINWLQLLERLLVITAYMYRYPNKLRRSKPNLIGLLTAEELYSAQLKWIQNCQRVYSKEMSSAKFKPGHYKASMPPLVRQLGLFVDDAGLLQCGGRIYNAPLSELAKFSYLLPQNNHLTELIVYTACTYPFFPCRCWIYLVSTQTVILDTNWMPVCEETVTWHCL